MKIIFMGSPEFAIPGLVKLYESDHVLSSVVSGTDKRRGRGNKTTPTPVKAKAIELGLPVIEVDNLNDPDFAEQLRGLEPDLFVVIAFRVLPVNLLTIPRIGSVNLHASLLPKYRGAAPIHHAIMAGEKVTGCTVFFLDEKVDTGNILAQKTLPIGQDDTAGTIYQKMMIEGADLLLDSVNKIESGDYSLKKQNDEYTSYAPKIFAKNCVIDFNRPCQEVHNFIRGLSPNPTARVYLDNKLFKIYTSKVVSDNILAPSIIKLRKDEVLIGCKAGAISLGTVQLEGKQKTSAVEFFRGYEGEKKIQQVSL